MCVFSMLYALWVMRFSKSPSAGAECNWEGNRKRVILADTITILKYLEAEFVNIVKHIGHIF